MPTQTKSGRANHGHFGTDPTYNSPKAYRSRVTQGTFICRLQNRSSLSYSLTLSSITERLNKADRETDNHRLHQRQKQIDYGKNTSGYLNYVAGVPMYVSSLLFRLASEHFLTRIFLCSDSRTKSDPWTPDIYKKYPKRVWDVIVRTWRRQLHRYDEEGTSPSFENSPELRSDGMPSLNDSLSSEDDLIDSIHDAIHKFQQEEEDQSTPQTFNEFSSSSSQLDSLIYSFDAQKAPTHASSTESSAHMTPYSSRVASLGFAPPEDSNSSMDSTTSTPASIFSDTMSLDYMSENSSDSWTSMPLTPIAMLGSPFQPISRSSSLVSTPVSFRGSSRSASQHYGASASQHSSPYGPIGQIPRFQLPPASPMATSASSSNKSASQDENVENTSQLFWAHH